MGAGPRCSSTDPNRLRLYGCEPLRLNFGWLYAFSLSPFALLHLAGANWPMFGVNIMQVNVMRANIWALKRESPPVVSFSVMCLLLVALAATSTASLGWPMGTRVLMSLGFVLVMINVVLNGVGELGRALVAQAITDALTGASNRRHLQKHLAQQVVPVGRAATGDALPQAELLQGEAVTVSIGLRASMPGRSVDAWLQAANAALYEAERQGRNRIVVSSGA